MGFRGVSMADWGGKYARHDAVGAKFLRGLDVSDWTRLYPPQRACDCWKQAAPLCEACRKAQDESRG